MNRRVIVLAFAAWTLIALYFASQAYLNPAYMTRPPWKDVLAVNFTYYASGAIVFAPESASRSDIVAGIGRGLGRGAVHEFAHQMLSRTNLHHSRDRGSYDYYAASRVEQYYGPMHWDLAGPVLKSQYGHSDFTARRSGGQTPKFTLP